MSELDLIRTHSERMFGSLYRLEVSCAIAEEPTGVVWLTGLAEQLQLSPARVHKPLQQLVSLGLLEALPVPRGQQARYYRRVDGAYWPFVIATRADAARTSPETRT